jgi:hypothetical protein
MSAVTLKRVGRLSLVAQILVSIAAMSAVVAALAGIAIADDAERYLDEEITRSEFQTTIVPYSLVGLVQGAATLGAVVFVVMWMYRMAANHRMLHRVGRWGPGWAIGGWFLPPFLYVIPFLMLRELWKASDPEVPIGGEWRDRPVSLVVTAWFVVYGPVSLVAQLFTASTAFNLSNSETALAEQLVDKQAATAFAAGVGLLAAVLFVMMARRLTDRHRRLIGEH